MTSSADAPVPERHADAALHAGLPAALAELFAPWVQDLALTVEPLPGDGVTLRLRRNERLSRVGGMVCGQALMAGATRRWCWR